MVVAFVLVDYEPVRNLLRLDEFYTSAVVFLSAWLIDAIGIAVVADGAMLRLSSAAMYVKFGCNGLEAILLFMAAVLAYPSSWRLKIIGIIVGSTILQILNILRIALLAWVLEYHPQNFALMHEYVTQSIMIALAFILFLFYLQVSEHEHKNR